MLNAIDRPIYSEAHNQFGNAVRKFFDQSLLPNLQKWEEDGIVARDFWLGCGDAGLLCPTVPEAYGGLGLDFGFNAVIAPV